jgi:hypothetical protein
MHINPMAIAKIGGAAVILALIVLAIVWFQSDYTIEGTIAIDTGMGVRPASQIEVRLIDSAAEREIATYVSEYESLKQDLVMACATQLFDRLGEAPPAAETAEPTPEQPGETTSGTALTIENLISGGEALSAEELEAEHPEVQRIVRELNRKLEPLTDAERTQVTARVQKYLQYALYCRGEADVAPVGTEYYERAAQYWEDRATRLKEMGRLLVDDAQPSYETSWLPYAGLGEEPSQKVITVVRADKRAQLGVIEETGSAADKTAKQSQQHTPAKPPRTPVEEGGVIAGAPVTSNAIFETITAAQQRLRQQYVNMLTRSDEKLLAMTVQQEATDEDGKFVFKGNAIQPGEFMVFARYDMLTTDGEQVEFMWFQPVTISLRRFAIDKSTVLALDELNQHRPACLDVPEPTREELFAEVVDILKTRRERIERGG